MTRVILLAIVCVSFACVGIHPGLENLATKAYSPTIMDPQIFDNLWRSWDPPAREAAQQASGTLRRQMTLDRYGLLEAPFDNGGAPLGFVVKGDGSYAMTCLICHAGAVAGRTVLGLPNSALDFSAIFEDVERTVTILHADTPGHPSFPQGLMFMTGGKAAAHIEFPEGLLGVSKGTTNSFTFSMQFFSLRDAELNIVDTPLSLNPINHYLDPPPWWHVAKKTTFYSDGFVDKSVRPLMQFSLDPSIGPALFRSWEDDYKEIYDWLHTVASPRYDGVIRDDLAARGGQVYSRSCAQCHGTPGRGGRYPNTIVPIDVVNTDRARLEGVNEDFKSHLGKSWLGEYGATVVRTRAQGYVAPPLDGIWASAPYFHNGSVPTLYHVLFPGDRPAVWKVTDYREYDHARGGLVVEEHPRMPHTHTLSEKRSYYDTTRATMSNRGHLFAEALSREERLSLLEYLKSL